MSRDIQTSYRKAFSQKASQVLSLLKPEDFIPGLDLKMMYRQMFLATEGYLWEMTQQGGLSREGLRQDFGKLLEFWKSTYYSEEKKHECH